MLAQYAQHRKSMAVRMAEVEEDDAEQIQTDFTVSLHFIVSSLLDGFSHVVAL